MKLKVRILKFLAGKPVCMVHEKTAEKMSLHVDNRVLIKKGNKKLIAIADTVSGILKPNEIAVSEEIVRYLELRNRSKVEVEITSRPYSIELIKRKLNGQELTKKEINEIIKDIANNALTEAEVAFFISAVYSRDMSLKETKYLIRSMVDTGSQLRLRGKIADKHCIGGVAGNRTTPIIISICSSLGVIMPKTSSRAITSAAGTADVIESIARVEFSVPEIYKIIKKTNACMVWGGSLGLAPADDKIIQIERLLNLDPEPQLLASILAKKLAVDSKYVLIDIPCGNSAKVSRIQALHLKKKFETLARDFKINLKCVLTDGSHPIGRGVGPVLEIKDVLSVLKQEPNRPFDLEKKSLMLSGLLLEMTRKAKKGKGEELAKKILLSGKALKKFQEIIKAQHGHLNNLKLGPFSQEIKAKKSGKIVEINNKKINFLARLLGCPTDKGAGIYLFKNKNSKIKKNEPLLA